MSKYLGYRDGGKTNEEGLYRFIAKLFKTGIPGLDSASTTMAVSQRGAGANMSVDIAVGDVLIPYSTYLFTGFTDAIENVSVDAADPSNGRKDIVVAYVDLSVVDDTVSNNPDALKFKVVAGTPSGSPAFPDNTAIQASVGGSNPWVELGGITLSAADTSVTDGKITDRRKPVSLMARLWGGASNTIGHLVPNVADDTIALLAAAQTLLNKTLTAPIINNPTISGFSGWQLLGYTPNSVVANGNGNFDLTYSGVDLTGLTSAGMRLRLARTVAAPTQSTSLNGTNQYYSKSSPNGMTFTDDFLVSGWIKLTSYQDATIASRYNGTSGWVLKLTSSGVVSFEAYNGGSGNISYLQNYRSIPLNKWVHIAAQLDMSAFSTTPTTSYVMIDGVDVPVFVSRAGTNPTALAQAGNLEIGSRNGGSNYFSGKLAQIAIYSNKVAQSTVLAAMTKGLVGTETDLISAYSFNNSINDLNTTNANNLTAQNSAVATNADSPFGNSGISSTLEYGIIQESTFSTDTVINVQVPNGCQIPTSGGISAVLHSGDKAPLNFPTQKDKWTLYAICKNDVLQSSPTSGVWYNLGNLRLSVPKGVWEASYKTTVYIGNIGAGIGIYTTLSNSSSTDSDDRFTLESETPGGTSQATSYPHTIPTDTIRNSAMTPYYLNTKHTGGGTSNIYNFGGRTTTKVAFVNGYL